MWRMIASGVVVVLAAASGVITALVTTHPSVGLWLALGVLVLAGGILQAASVAKERRSARRIGAFGAGAVAVGGTAKGGIRTHVHGGKPAKQPDSADGDVTAAGPGAIAIGGDAEGISTDVTDV
jgi:hypothetical protein